MQFDEKYIKAQEAYKEKIAVESVAIDQIHTLMKDVPLLLRFLDTPSFSFCRLYLEFKFLLGNN